MRSRGPIRVAIFFIFNLHSLIADRFYQIAGESWPFYNQGESQAKRYLEQMDGILSIVNENNDLLWYVRGKSLNGGNHGRIYRASNQTKSDFNLSTSPHGNAPNTCNNNNLRYNTRAKVDRNYNGFNSAINGNHEPRRKWVLFIVEISGFFLVLHNLWHQTVVKFPFADLNIDCTGKSNSQIIMCAQVDTVRTRIAATKAIKEQLHRYTTTIWLAMIFSWNWRESICSADHPIVSSSAGRLTNGDTL